ncbi:aminotransferase [Chryseotalea sanaruensis]|uniref:Aminotransferase n=1 Tax=Chryseotalea sanaruensis TaxID=2482724 RepID=A0A401UFG7_9BACT|nr:aminotransferase class I/II-fold pyridoxal phosphate-dependent enzyme [Chryseotalea sanaruensis]GCC53651.1 aminotransferase [Chryseotalea sanaruensis]
MIASAKRIEQVEEYYFSKKLAEVRSLDSVNFPIINLGIGSPDMPPAPAVIAALTKAAENASNHGYQNYKGAPVLRQAIAAFHERMYGVTLNAETEILPLMGSKEGIMHVSMAFVNEGDEILIPNPGYPTYSSVSKLVGAKLVSYDLDEANDWRIDIGTLRQRDLSKVKLMWLNYPHMPTGTRAMREDIIELVALAKEKNFLLINDNPYSLILNDEPFSILSMPGAEEVVLELNSISKSHNMAGWRIGWVAGKQTYIDAVLRVKSNMDSGMFLPLQLAAAEALRLGDDWFKQLNATYAKRKVLAEQILKQLGCAFSSNQSGLFVWAKVPNTVHGVEAFVDKILYEAKVFITPGFIFGSNGERFIRISLCATEEKLKEALTRIQLFQQDKSVEKVLTAVI